MTPASLTFVLIHGAFQNGAIWEQTAGVLRANGHTVHTPTLAGHRPGDPMTLAHADAVASLTAYLHDHDLSDVVLVGHSIGGAYIAQTAVQALPRIKRLVFLSAFVPAAGHTLADEFPPADAAFFDMTDPAQGFLLPFPVIRERACNDMDSAAATAIYAQMSPIPVRYFTDKLDLETFHELVGSGRLQASYVNPVSDFALPPGEYASFPRFAQRLGPLARILQIPGSHYVMFSRPAELADTLVSAGRD
ncbi:alpha/beta hydrolase [Nocardia sp. NEAU-G5]|uniref:Alpha/beta hydrolase n=1 Tax=Nocardia albiluteola TaxID=2842303 RepID=A0ABS6ATD0_9NOCA|nr:alpha/beta hydrolase [Nocardia albiluteola]MBU3060269.1 alpha/beta hydrolase [Nocardia albiluteola]